MGRLTLVKRESLTRHRTAQQRQILTQTGWPDAPESVAGSDWNEWPDQIGIPGRMGPECAAEDQRHKRQLVSAFVLRHGRLYPRTKPWTMRYRRWLQSLTFDHPAHQIALQEMLQAEGNATERLDRLTGHIEALVPEWDLAPAVNALQALRGVALISAVTFMAEIGDVGRFKTP